MYKRLIVALLVASLVIARPQEDTDGALEEILELPGDIVDADGPIDALVTSCTSDANCVAAPEGPKCSGSSPNPNSPKTCGPNPSDCNPATSGSSTAKRCAAGYACPTGGPGPHTCVKGGCESDSQCTTDVNKPICNKGTATCEKCSQNDCKGRQDGKTVCSSAGACVAPTSSGCTGSGLTDSCTDPTKYCDNGTCKTGCRTGAFFATTSPNCPNTPTSSQTYPALCKTDHTCQYSTCKTDALTGSPLKCTTGTCTKGTNNLYTCVVTPPTPTPVKCNAYKKCAKGSYCDKRECKPGCDKKRSACKTADNKKGTCDGNHVCQVPTTGLAGWPCKKDKNCATDYKCIRDIGHDSHCHKAVGKDAPCNQNVLFPDVCKKGFSCKKNKNGPGSACKEDKHHKKNKYDD